MKILVTGGCGFIGSNFIRLLIIETDYEIVNIDKLTYAGNPENVREFEGNPRYRFVKGDICDKEIVENTVQECDAIINFAAETHVDRSITDPDAFIRTNVFGTYTLLEAARKQNIKKFVQISTDEVYGSVETGSSREDDSLDPRSPYSASKAAGDLLALSYFTTYNLPVMVTRSSNNYGPYHYPEKLIPLFITNLLECENVPVYGNGQQVRDWVYVEDNCRAILAVLEKGVPGLVHNIGADQEKTNMEVTKTLIEQTGRDESFIMHVKDRPGHDRRYSLDSSRIRSIGWSPRMTFEEGIKKTVEWYKANSNWWKPIKSGEFREYYRRQYRQ